MRVEEKINGREIAVMDDVSLARCLLQAPVYCNGTLRSSELIDDLLKLTVVSAALDYQPIDNKIIGAIVRTGPYMGLEKRQLEMVCVLKFKTASSYPLTVKLVGIHDSDIVYGNHFRGYVYCWKTTDEEIASWIEHDILS